MYKVNDEVTIKYATDPKELWQIAQKKYCFAEKGYKYRLRHKEGRKWYSENELMFLGFKGIFNSLEKKNG